MVVSTTTYCLFSFLFVVVVAVVVADDEEDSEREMKYLSFSDFVMDGVDGELLVEAFVLTVLN